MAVTLESAVVELIPKGIAKAVSGIKEAQTRIKSIGKTRIKPRSIDDLRKRIERLDGLLKKAPSGSTRFKKLAEDIRRTNKELTKLERSQSGRGPTRGRGQGGRGSGGGTKGGASPLVRGAGTAGILFLPSVIQQQYANQIKSTTSLVRTLRSSSTLTKLLTKGQNTLSTNLKGLGTQLERDKTCLLYTSPSPRDRTRSRMPSSA